MELITLSQRICGKAELKLRQRIDEQTENLRSLLRDAAGGNNWFVKISGVDAANTNNQVVISVHWHHCLQAVKDALFEQMAPAVRQKAIDEFLKNLEKPNPPTT